VLALDDPIWAKELLPGAYYKKFIRNGVLFFSNLTRSVPLHSEETTKIAETTKLYNDLRYEV
jgi:hypothetical protein